jgi:hypothetical protein
MTRSGEVRFALINGQCATLSLLPLATALRVLAATKSISANCGCRSMTDEGKALIRKNVAKTARRANQCPPPRAKIFRFRRRANQWFDSACPTPQRGVSRSSRTRGGMRWTRQRFARDGIAGRVGERPVSGHQASGREMLQRTAKSCGPDAPTLASSLRSRVGPTGFRQDLIR